MFALIETLSQWLFTNYKDVFFFVGGGLVFMYVTNIWRNFLERVKKLESDMDVVKNIHIPAINTKLEKMEGKLDEITTVLNKISTFLVATFNLDPRVFSSKSPIQLGPVAEKMLAATGGKQYIDMHLDRLLQDISQRNPKCGLDVETASIVLLYQNVRNDDFTPIKQYVFQNPVFKTEELQINLDLAMAIRVMGIYLRNRYLDKYPAMEGRNALPGA